MRASGRSRCAGRGRPSRPSTSSPPSTRSTRSIPIRLTTGRRLDSYNTGVQTGGYASPLRRGESLDLSPEDARRYGLEEGERVRVSSRRGSVVAPVRTDATLRPGLAFMTLHFPDDVATNLLTIDATDPQVRDRRVQGHGDPDRSARLTRRAQRRRRGDDPERRWGGDARRLVDLHFGKARPTSAERHAIDEVLGPPESGWVGGRRRPELDGHFARGGQEARSRRHLLLPAFHAAQARAGFISEGALTYICQRLTVPPAEAYGVASFYAMFSLTPAGAQRRARLRRRRLPPEGRGGALRASGGVPRPARQRQHARGRDVAAQPLPRTLRAGAGGAGDPRGGEASRGGHGRGDRRPRARGAPRRGTRGRTRVSRIRRRRRCRSSASRGCGSSRGSARSIPRASTTIARTAATRRCAARSSSAPKA